jgi:inosine/xanthosine triphosphate pyrophosphatase family protein
LLDGLRQVFLNVGDPAGCVVYTVITMRKVLLASNNQGKVERYKNLITMAGLLVEIVTPAEVGIEEVDVIEDGQTLAENAEKKATAYLGKTDLPILANDTGFWLETEGFVDAPKRFALEGQTESSLSKAEIADKLVSFWQEKARANGGRVDAAWVEAFVLLQPDGTKKAAKARREVILTDTIFGEPHIQMPVRALYISKTTNKPATVHTAAEELEEMQPVVVALKELFEG